MEGVDDGSEGELNCIVGSAVGGGDGGNLNDELIAEGTETVELEDLA